MTRRWIPFTVLAVAATGIIGITASALEGGLTYYVTPTDMVRDPAPGMQLRIGGIVVPGSLVSGETSSMTLTDGATDVRVSYPGPVPAVVREGEGAVVTGHLDTDGILVASDVVLRHSNEYQRAP